MAALIVNGVVDDHIALRIQFLEGYERGEFLHFGIWKRIIGVNLLRPETAQAADSRKSDPPRSHHAHVHVAKLPSHQAVQPVTAFFHLQKLLPEMPERRENQQHRML